MKYFVFALALMAFSPSFAEAKARMSTPLPVGVDANKCGFKDDVTLSVSFNFPSESFRAAKTKFDEKIKQVEDFGKSQNVKKFELQSMNYSINGGNYRGSDENFQLSGSMSYKMDSFDSAVKMGEFLTQQKFTVNMSANSYRTGNCPQ